MTDNKQYPPLPMPDTPCFDEDPGQDVWSYSESQMRAYVDADRAMRAAQAAPASQDAATGLKDGDIAALVNRLQHIESAALQALGILWMSERTSEKTQAAFKTLRDALGGRNALRKGIEAAIDAGYEADHPPGADWWAGKKDE